MRCLHINGGVADVHDVIAVAMNILIPHYEVGFFNERLFHIEFDQRKYLELSGADLMKLATKGELAKPLQTLKLPSSSHLPMKQSMLAGNSGKGMLLSEQNSRD